MKRKLYDFFMAFAATMLGLIAFYCFIMFILLAKTMFGIIGGIIAGTLVVSTVVGLFAAVE